MSLDVRILSARYRGREVLSGVGFRAESGTLTAVIGRNGSGKSTLVSCMASLVPYEGEVCADGVRLSELDVRARARYLSAMLQELRRPHVTVRELVAFGRQPYRSVWRSTVASDARVDGALEAADLLELADRYVDQLSGGEVRRAYFGALLAQDAPNVILDEATAFMDADYERRFLEMACALRDGGKTVVAVMHDLSAAVRYADRILLLENGTQRFFGCTEDLLRTDLVERAFSVRRYSTPDLTLFTGL